MKPPGSFVQLGCDSSMKIAKKPPGSFVQLGCDSSMKIVKKPPGSFVQLSCDSSMEIVKKGLLMNAKQILLCSLVFTCLLGCAQKRALYVGTSTGQGSQGIYRTTFDARSGALAEPVLVAELQNPTFQACDSEGTRLLSIGETSSGKLFGFHVTPEGLTQTGTRSSAGRGPCHVAMDPSGHWAVVSNYGSGTVASYPVRDNGAPGPAVSQIQWPGTPRAHSATFSADGRWVIFADLGNDRLWVYAFDTETGVLTPAPTPWVDTESGAGPRHTTFHPSGRFFYVANELNSTVSFYLWANEDGTLTEQQTLDLMARVYEGRRSTADIHVSPDGRFLYVSNRGDANSITIYAIDQATGRLTRVAMQACGGRHPRNFTIDPTGRYLLVANRDTDNIVVFRRDQETGQLESTGQALTISRPMCLTFQP